MTMARLLRAIFWLTAGASILGTASISICKLRYQDQSKENTSAAQPLTSPLLSPDTKLLALRAIAKYRAAKPRRASDHFHRWRFEALEGVYSLNRELQIGMGQMLAQKAFRKTFPGSAPLFFRSPYGWEVRQRTAKHAREHWEYEHHVDQFLATCAEVGAPLALSIETDFGTVSVGELLEASRRSYDSSQEPCWTLVAYCAYLPEESQWENRFGELCSYESMVKGILSLPLDSGSCGGTHKQFALAYFLNCPASTRLDSSLRRQCEEYLNHSSRLLERSQLPSGAWSPLWAAGTSELADPPEARSIRGVDLVRITGHQLEWVGIAPAVSRPSSDSTSRALRFVAEVLNQVDGATMQGDYCAYSHAACVLRRALMSESLGPRPIEAPSAGPAPENLGVFSQTAKDHSPPRKLLETGNGP
jgi:hypothetical protein